MSSTVDPDVQPPPADSRGSTSVTGQRVAPEAHKRLTDRYLTVLVCQVAVVVVVLGGWQLAVERSVIDELNYGSPLGAIEQMRTFYESGRMFDQSWATLQAAILAWVIGVPAGTLIGLVLALSSFLNRVFSPFIVPLNSLPRIAFAPLFLLWFGLTIWAKVSLAVSIVVFIMMLNTRAGVRNVDPDLISVSRLLGLKSHEMMRKVALPFAVPSVMAGFRLCVTYGLLGVVASEMIAARDGLGLEIVTNSNSLNVNGVYAVLATLAAIAVVLSLVTERIERWLLRWQ